MPDLSQLRKDYSLRSLDEKDVNPDPFRQFGQWFEEAKECISGEVNAMVLSTVGIDAQPSSRVVLLKGFSEEGFVFFTNYESHKGNDLAINPKAALLFFWGELERQIRIEGITEKVSPQESSDYFAVRPRLSQVGAVASEQSRLLTDRGSLEKRFHRIEQEYHEKDIPRPSHWGGYILKPVYFEFWQGRRSRLHDRIFYEPQTGGWKTGRLYP
jgi:pyridoxamine 5'-phosphate oxidase